MECNVLIHDVQMTLSEEPGKVGIVIDFGDSLLHPRMVGATIDTFAVGYVLGHLIETLQVVTTGQIRNQPARLVLDGERWVLKHFLQDKVFDIDEIAKASISDVLHYSTMANTNQG